MPLDDASICGIQAKVPGFEAEAETVGIRRMIPCPDEVLQLWEIGIVETLSLFRHVHTLHSITRPE